MTLEEFEEDEMSKLPHSFREAIENGTKKGSPGLLKYLVERMAFVRWEAQDSTFKLLYEIKFGKKWKPGPK